MYIGRMLNIQLFATGKTALLFSQLYFVNTAFYITWKIITCCYLRKNDNSNIFLDTGGLLNTQLRPPSDASLRDASYGGHRTQSDGFAVLPMIFSYSDFLYNMENNNILLFT